MQIPTTAGNLLPLVSIQLVRPSLPPKQDAHLPVPPTIFDASAAPVLTPVDKIGLPWMKEESNSPGPVGDNLLHGNRASIGWSGFTNLPANFAKNSRKPRPPRCSPYAGSRKPKKLKSSPSS